MASPVWTYNNSNAALANTTLNSNGAITTFAVNAASFMAAQIQISSTAGTVNTTQGTQFTVYRVLAVNTADTIPVMQLTITNVANSTVLQSVELSSGSYSCTLKDLDPANNVNAAATTATLSWPS